MLKEGNVLTWNVWVNHPELVDQEEWQEHAEKWRKSIDVNHISPERWVSPARFHDGTLLPVPKDLVAREVAKIREFRESVTKNAYGNGDGLRQRLINRLRRAVS